MIELQEHEKYLGAATGGFALRRKDFASERGN